MIKKITITLLGTFCLWSGQASSSSTYTLVPGVAVEYILPAHEPKVFINPVMWAIKASCTVRSTDDENSITLKVLHRSGTLDDAILERGDTLEIVVNNGYKFRMSAEAGAKVELTNHGEHALTAVCTTA